MDQKIITNKIKTNMKTQEQIKQEIVSYLTKTAGHTFIRPKTTFKWDKENSHYEYDYDQFTYFKVFKIEEDFFYLESNNGQNTPTSYKLYKIDVDSKIRYYEGNAKCVINHNLFLGKKMKSVKSNKYHIGEIEKILETLR
jgi:hypothetical protein